MSAHAKPKTCQNCGTRIPPKKSVYTVLPAITSGTRHYCLRCYAQYRMTHGLTGTRSRGVSNYGNQRGLPTASMLWASFREMRRGA